MLPLPLYSSYFRLHVLRLRVIRPIHAFTLNRAAANSVQIRSMRICRSPQSLTYVSSWGFTRLPPSCNSNYLESMNNLLSIAGVE
ncbi:hypothetical protein DWS23_01310 [Escherichia coli]|nr:hypothetical protein [Escherichia coli]